MSATNASNHAAGCSCGSCSTIPLAVAVDREHAAATRGRVALDAANRTDPTETTTLRSRYSAEMYRRFRALKGAILEAVVEKDVLGLHDGDMAANSRAARGRRLATLSARERDDIRFARQAQGRGIDIETPRPGAFDFPSNEEKVREFRGWLDEQVDRGILETATFERRGAHEQWQSTYLRQSYEKGVTHADDALVREGVIDRGQAMDDVFRAPKHADGVGLIYTRAYDELRGVTEAMDQQISRNLAEGLSQGLNPQETGRMINDRVDNVGLHRGRMIARTETIRAHSEGGLNRYEELEGRLEGVAVLAEHVTAEDGDLCARCAALAGETYTVKEARGRIPVHPNCRCTFVPVRKNADDPATVSDRVDTALMNDDLNAAQTVSEIDSALEDGVSVNSSSLYPLDPERAATVAHTMERLEDSGELRRANIRSLGTDRSTDAVAYYDWSEDARALNFNPRKFDDDTVSGLINDGWLTGDADNPLETTILHEVGHARHRESLRGALDEDGVGALQVMRNRELGGFEESDARGISRYAATEPVEYVAEAYAHRAAGNDLSLGQESLYEDLHGPDTGTIRGMIGNADSYMGAGHEYETMSDPPDDMPEELEAELEQTRESFRSWIESTIEDHEDG